MPCVHVRKPERGQDFRGTVPGSGSKTAGSLPPPTPAPGPAALSVWPDPGWDHSPGDTVTPCELSG